MIRHVGEGRPGDFSNLKTPLWTLWVLVHRIKTSLRLPGEPFDRLRGCDFPGPPYQSVEKAELGSFFANSEDLS